MKSEKLYTFSILIIVIGLLMSNSRICANEKPKFLGRIIYTKLDKKLKNQIMMINGETGEIKQITKKGTNLSPKWSPDGNKIVFTSRRESHKGSEIYVMNADGADQRRLTITPLPGGSNHPRWNHDGTAIYFTYAHKGNVEERLINFANGKEVTLSSTGRPDIKPRPDIRSYIDEMLKKEGAEEELKKEVEENAREIDEWTMKMGQHYRAYESPDGKNIALYYPMTRNLAIFNTMSRIIKGFDYKNTGLPAWSKNGKLLAFVSGYVHETRLVIYDAYENKFDEIELNVKGETSCGGEMSWSPDSQKIVYPCGPLDITSPEDERKILLYIFDIETETSYRLTEGYSPDWQ